MGEKKKKEDTTFVILASTVQLPFPGISSVDTPMSNWWLMTFFPVLSSGNWVLTFQHFCQAQKLKMISLHLCLHAQSCLTLCDPIDCSPPGSSVHEIFQTRILEWAAISYYGGSSRPRDEACILCISCKWFSEVLICIYLLWATLDIFSYV